MIDPVNQFEQLVGARLLDFFGTSTPWHRGLWNPGLCLVLREVLEASDAVRASVLSEHALGDLTNSAQVLAGTDPGAGSPDQRKTLQTALRAKPRSQGLDYHVVARSEEACRLSYLERWADALKPPVTLGPERVARSIAAHLLDGGYSPEYLHRWWKFHLYHEAAIRSLSDIVREAQALARTPPRDYTVLVPLAKAFLWKDQTPPPEWCAPREVSAWLKAEGFEIANVRQDGGFLLTVQAMDAHAAASRASEVIDQLRARTLVGTRRALTILGQAWVRGETKPQPLDQARRGVWVEALDRENQLFDGVASGGIHAAIELLSHLQVSSPAAAVAGGWAAVEALLSEPSDRAGAADRLALLTACSFPRAELTALSYAIEKRDTKLVGQLAGVTENRLRCEVVMKALQAGTAQLAALRPSDHAAAVRMTALGAQPRVVLNDVREHAATAFRRLYRQRNLVLHWGKTDGVALRASLRTASPLVGAGIDRIIHAHYVDGLSPLQVTAKATMALATVGSSAGPTCINLLD